jgi:hypothetical protein
MLEEIIKLHGFAGISPEETLAQAGRLRETMVGRPSKYGHPLLWQLFRRPRR